MIRTSRCRVETVSDGNWMNPRVTRERLISCVLSGNKLLMCMCRCVRIPARKSDCRIRHPDFSARRDKLGYFFSSFFLGVCPDQCWCRKHFLLHAFPLVAWGSWGSASACESDCPPRKRKQNTSMRTHSDRFANRPCKTEVQ